VIVYCATTNAGKLKEFRKAAEIAACDVEVVPGLKEIPAPDETGATFEANAILKAEYYGARTNGYLFADDSGLEVDALCGAPGVHSARYAELEFVREVARRLGIDEATLLKHPMHHVLTQAAEAAGPTGDAANNALLLTNLTGTENRTARFVCVIALVKNGRLLKTFRGTVEGQIAQHESGPHGFGYDPLFYCPPFGCTFGEADLARKAHVSHRGNALRLMFEHLSHSSSIAT